jgi:acyl-CoA thioesterase
MEMPDSYKSSAFTNLLGCELLSLGEDGTAELRLGMREELRNRGGKLHGGAIFTLVDVAMGLACSASHGFDEHSVTLECKINYLRGVAEGDVLCRARVLHAGRRTLMVEAEVLQGDKLVAKAGGTFVRV